MRSHKLFSITLILAIAMAGIVLASNVELGPPVKGELLSIKQVKNIRMLEVRLKENSLGPGMKQTKSGTVVTCRAEDNSVALKVGQTVKVQWRYYSAMGENGPVSATSWQLAP